MVHRLLSAVLLSTIIGRIRPQVVLHSTYRCEGDEPVQRSCSFTNVCYDGKDFLYYTRDVRDIPPRPLVNLGVYSSSPVLNFKLSERDLEISDAEWVDIPSLLMFRSHPKHYFHTLLDDFLGLYRLMFFYSHGKPSADNQLLLMDDFRPADDDDHFKEIREVFSKREPQRLSYLYEALGQSQGLLCFRHLAAGPGQYQLAGPGINKVSAVLAEAAHHSLVDRSRRPSCGISATSSCAGSNCLRYVHPPECAEDVEGPQRIRHR